MIDLSDDENRIDIGNNSDVSTSTNSAIKGIRVSIIPKKSDYKIVSFKMNGELIEGNTFVMPDKDAIITDIILEKYIFDIVIDGNDDIKASSSTAKEGEKIVLNSKSGNYKIVSFKMNGELVEGSSFVMPAEDVTITDVATVLGSVIESEHSPYPNNLNNKVYGEKKFDGATSLEIELDYQTESTNYDWIYLYDSTGKSYGKYGGTTRKTEIITIPGDYVKVVFRTDGSSNDYYGFKATVTPNYD